MGLLDLREDDFRAKFDVPPRPMFPTQRIQIGQMEGAARNNVICGYCPSVAQVNSLFANEMCIAVEDADQCGQKKKLQGTQDPCETVMVILSNAHHYRAYQHSRS
jgi:hypothetical protein